MNDTNIKQLIAGSEEFLNNLVKVQDVLANLIINIDSDVDKKREVINKTFDVLVESIFGELVNDYKDVMSTASDADVSIVYITIMKSLNAFVCENWEVVRSYIIQPSLNYIKNRV